MHPGLHFDNRFDIHMLAGAGGMGRVFRAHDRQSGQPVALKLLHAVEETALARFSHEARALARLEHPHIVRFVAYGVAPSGEPYLALEWLDGETLEQRLAREGLRLEETIELARRVSAALAAAHACGVVHRDVKPSNIFLPGGAVERVKVFDFGIARIAGATHGLTQAGTVLGTPGYMAPEQARGETESFDARADVFSLGCVLFECLTGRPAFQGAHAMALLAKLLLEEVPRARELRPEIPAALDALVARMLVKDSAERPADGQAVLTALDAMAQEDWVTETVLQQSPAAAVLTTSERRLISIVAIQADRPSLAPGATEPAAGTPYGLVEALRRAAAPLGARVEQLADGTAIAALTGTGNPSDQAARTARAALAARAVLADAKIVLVTGQAERSGRLPVGEVLERAAALLSRGPAPGRVLVDEATRALLGGRFDVLDVPGDAAVLRHERTGEEEVRTLLGKPSPFVGRERELRYLVDLVEDAFGEPRALVMLVTAPAGMGKSRLRHEVVRALRARHERLVVATGRGDIIGAGSAFGMLSSALRSGMQLEAGQPAAAQRARIAWIVEQYVGPTDVPRVAAFLGELAGIPFPDKDRPQLASARQNAQIMADQVRSAYVDFVRGVSRVNQALLVLEDLHWGDAPSIQIVDAALRALEGLPFVVLAFARPEVHELFPRLWTERGAQELRLRELPKKAAERLVCEVLGERIAPEDVPVLVERAGGNAFFLEELMRSAAEGRSSLPYSVVAMVQSRLDALGPELRRILRAASVFGEGFWVNGLRVLLGEEGTDVEGKLVELAARELIAPRAERRLAGEAEYAFRHALVREGAYAMLTDRDRALGHRLAADWLLGVGEQDPIVLAEHLERGGERVRAAAFYASAAEQSLTGGDVEAVFVRADRGLACGAGAEVQARLYAVRADARLEVLDYGRGHEDAMRALEMATPGSVTHVHALGTAIACAFMVARDALRHLLPLLLTTEPAVEAAAMLGRALLQTVGACLYSSSSDAAPYLHRVRQILEALEGRNPEAAAWCELTLAFIARIDDPWRALGHDRAAVEHFEAAGDRRSRTFAVLELGHSLAMLGALAEAEQLFERAFSEKSVESVTAHLGIAYRCTFFLASDKPQEILALVTATSGRNAPASGALSALFTHICAVEALIAVGKLAEAEEALAAGAGAELTDVTQVFRAYAYGALQLRKGMPREAAETAREALARPRAKAIFLFFLPEKLHLLLAESLHAAGDLDGARASIREARDELFARAATIPDPMYRRSFLENIPSRWRVIELARKWLVEDCG
jgi:tetratricopeptide (TPR) repeat protein